MTEKKKIVETPLMKQYFEVKAQHPDALLLFRVGDFYETFGEDAVTASKILGIVLTKRAIGSAQHVELAGFPHHSIQTYLPKLVRAGYKVAVCDQLEDPKLTKKIVKRGVTELVTPGIAYSDQLLVQKENNYLGAVYFKGDKGGVAFLDISTGTFKVAEGSLDYIEVLLSNFAPKEVVLQKGYQCGFRERFGNNYYISTMDEWAFVPQACEEKLKSQFVNFCHLHLNQKKMLKAVCFCQKSSSHLQALQKTLFLLVLAIVLKFGQKKNGTSLMKMTKMLILVFLQNLGYNK